MTSAFSSSFAGCFGAEQNPALNSIGTQLSISEREEFLSNLLEQLPKSSQLKNADSITSLIGQLRTSGVCTLEGSDEVIRPACVGLQCLFEETFLANFGAFKKADFEIHTTMPSTPCCKLPDENAKESFLASFKDEARLVTIDGRSASLDAICGIAHATLHLTYTKAGFMQRSEAERMALINYWEPRTHTTCIESHEIFPPEINGASYRLLKPSGTEIFFGIQASQAANPDSKSFTVHLGTKDQLSVKMWEEELKSRLESFGRSLFAQ